VRRLLANAAAAERSGELQLRQFAAVAGDDGEVQLLFEESADRAQLHKQRLETRLAELGVPQSSSSQDLATALKAAPQIAQNARVVEEHLLQNLILASAMKAGECALYETLAVAAAAAGDSATEVLAREIEQREQCTLERFRHFLPSRSKIAFNMLTVSEVDPAVETKVKDDRPES
jgi:ferritin-like metal-binding protein YciE